MTEPKTIDAMYAWIATEPDGGEGVCAARIGDMMMPLIGADVDRAKSLRPYAKAARHARAPGPVDPGAAGDLLLLDAAKTNQEQTR